MTPHRHVGLPAASLRLICSQHLTHLVMLAETMPDVGQVKNRSHEPWASGWLCWKVFMPFLLLAQLFASNSDSAREKWQERLESLLISVWNWKPTGIIPFGFRRRFTSWRPCEFSPLEAWKHFSCHSVACRHGVLFTREVNQGSRSVWSFCKTLYFNKEKQKWQPDQCFSIYLFSKNKRKGSHQKMRSPEKCAYCHCEKQDLSFNSGERNNFFKFIYYLKYMKIARQGSYTFKILNFQTFFSVTRWHSG